MPSHAAASRRFVLFAIPAALLIAGASTAWAQAGATGSSSGTPGPATQGSGPTIPSPTGSGGAESGNSPTAPAPSGSGNPSGAPNVPGLDQNPPNSGSGGATPSNNGNNNPACTPGAPNAADCRGPAPQR